MLKKLRTKEDLSIGSKPHQAAIAQGPSYFQSGCQNVVDKYKGKSVEEIENLLQQTAHPFAVCFEHWINDFNMSSGVRNANAFNAKEVFYLGDKKWDRRGSVGTHNYTKVQWLATIDDFKKLKEKYTFIGIDNIIGSLAIENYIYPSNPLFCFGEEGVGLTQNLQSMCKDIVSISQYGSVRSLNCGTSSGIVMYDFMNKLKK